MAWYAWVTDSQWLTASDAYLHRTEIDYRRTLRSSRRPREFSAGRSLVRRLLSARLGIPPADIAMSLPDGDAPRLRVAGSPYYFSLSHSHGAIGCIVSATHPVGIDLEYTARARRIQSLVDTYPALADIEPAPTPFFQRWVSLEALSKFRNQPLVELMNLPFQLATAETLALHQQPPFVLATVTHEDDPPSLQRLP